MTSFSLIFPPFFFPGSSYCSRCAKVTFDFPAITAPTKKPKGSKVGRYMQQETFVKTVEIKAPRRAQSVAIRASMAEV